jgi:hypothetical protein
MSSFAAETTRIMCVFFDTRKNLIGRLDDVYSLCTPRESAPIIDALGCLFYLRDEQCELVAGSLASRWLKHLGEPCRYLFGTYAVDKNEMVLAFELGRNQDKERSRLDTFVDKMRARQKFKFIFDFV